MAGTHWYAAGTDHQVLELECGLPRPRAATKRRTGAYRRRGAAYVFFLGTALLVTVIGLSALAVTRVKLQAAEGGNDSAAARHLARSAIEFATLVISRTVDWRDTITHDAWQPEQEMSSGSFSWKLVDPTNDSLTADRSATVRICGRGTCGESVWIYSVLVQPPFATLPASILVNGDLEAGSEEPWWEYGDCTLTIEEGSGSAHSGTYGMKVGNRDWTAAGPRQTVAVQQGQSYQGSVWVQMENISEVVRLLLGIETDLGWSWYTLAEGEVAKDWTQLSGTVTPTWSGTLLSAVFKLETNTGPQDFFIDDASFTPAANTIGRIPGTWLREAQ